MANKNEDFTFEGFEDNGNIVVLKGADGKTKKIFKETFDLLMKNK
jgi:hypothetical protein